MFRPSMLNTTTAAANDISLFLTAFMIANIVQDIERSTPGIQVHGYDYFGDGTNPRFHQTVPGVLIFEGYYYSPVNHIHTPLGSWHIGLAVGGSSAVPWANLNNTIHTRSRFKLRLICPAYVEWGGIYGPWYLVTEFDGKSMGHDVPPFNGSAEKIYQSDSDEFDVVVSPRVTLLKSFYKLHKGHGCYSRESGAAVYEDALALAYAHKIWQDRTGIFDRARGALATPSVCKAILDEFRNRAPGMGWLTVRYLEKFQDALCVHRTNKSFSDLFKVLCYSDLY